MTPMALALAAATILGERDKMAVVGFTTPAAAFHNTSFWDRLKIWCEAPRRGLVHGRRGRQQSSIFSCAAGEPSRHCIANILQHLLVPLLQEQDGHLLPREDSAAGEQQREAGVAEQ